MSDIIVTGLPRSGLTVACALIDTLPNAVCLNNPPSHRLQARQLDTPLEFSKWLTGEFAWTRLQLQRGEPAEDFRSGDGAPLLDNIADPKRYMQDNKAVPVLFTREQLTPDFILGMKNSSLYTALLPTLVKFDHFTVIAVIRNPLDVIGSWQKFPDRMFAQGKVSPAVARYWDEALRISSLDSDTIDRMVQLYDAHLQIYYELQDKIQIVKFEDVIDDPLRIPAMLGRTDKPGAINRIESRTRILNRNESEKLAERIRKTAVFTKHFYKL